MPHKRKNIFSFVFNKPLVFMPVIIFIWGMLYILFGPVINMDGGLGYDGHYYGHMARRFLTMILGDQIDSYRIQRIFPSFVVYAGMNVLGISSSFPKIIKSFQIYNLILLLTCAVLWFKTARMFKLDNKFIWLGFVLWFLNFGVAEMAFYYPVLTDVSALCLGFGLLYAYKKDNLILKIMLSFIGGFTWPVLIYLGILMIIFPVTFKPDFQETDCNGTSKLKKFLIYLLPLPFLAAGVYAFSNYLLHDVSMNLDTEIIHAAFYPALVLNYFVMVYFLKCYFSKNISLKIFFEVFKKITKKIKPAHVIISVLIFLVIKIIQKNLSNDVEVSASMFQLFSFISLYGATKPLVYFTSYVNYFGPVFIIFFLYLKYVLKYAADLGISIYVFFIIPLITVFATEARLNIYFLPFFILPVILFLEKIKIRNFTLILLTVISFAFSKIYTPMYFVPDRNPDKFSFNNQLLFMNFHTVSVSFYFMLSAAVILAAILLINSLRRSENYSSLKDLDQESNSNFFKAE